MAAQEVGIGEGEGADGEAADIDGQALAEQDAVGVDEEDFSVGEQ